MDSGTGSAPYYEPLHNELVDALWPKQMLPPEQHSVAPVVD